MQKIFDTTVMLLRKFIELLLLLLIVGLIVGLLFPKDPFGVLANVKAMLDGLKPNAMAGVLTLFLIGVFYWKKN
jgi:hypothetical protein